MNTVIKKLYRSRKQRMILGILGGLGEYWNTDPTVLRLVFVLILFATGILPLALAYFAAYFIIPLEPENPA